MKPFEIFYSMLRPYLLSLHRIAYNDIKRLSIEKYNSNPLILDIGGRKSHVTIGVPGRIQVSDIPRVSEVQEILNLGFTDNMIGQIKKRRSNIESIVFDDMTHSNLPDKTYDICSAIEVLEHVEEDENFVKEVYRVLKPGGCFYMTTPNGDWKPIPHNADHKRHYKRQQLKALMEGVFDEVIVEYAVAISDYRRMGITSGLSLTHPIRSIKSMYGNNKNYKESILPEVKERAEKTAHLIAYGFKKKS